MQQESPDELVSEQGHGFRLACVTIILPLKADLTVFDIEHTVIGDCDTMSVTAYVVEHLLGSGERTLGIYDPLARFQSVEQLGEGEGLAESFQGGKELQFAGIERLPQGFQKEAAEEPRENPDRQEEARTA